MILSESCMQNNQARGEKRTFSCCRRSTAKRSSRARWRAAASASRTRPSSQAAAVASASCKSYGSTPAFSIIEKENTRAGHVRRSAETQQLCCANTTLTHRHLPTPSSRACNA